jgi:hypothetical protein
LREEYVVAPMDQEILKVFFYDTRRAVVMHFSTGAQFTKMAANGSEMIRCYSPCHLVLQMQPPVISFYGDTSRIRFIFLLFQKVSRN